MSDFARYVRSTTAYGPPSHSRGGRPCLDFYYIFLNILEIVARFARGKALMNNLLNDFCLL